MTPIRIVIVAAAFSHLNGQGPLKSPRPATGIRGAVTCASAPASKVGLAVLESGGNAVDAAVAVGFAMAVTYPAAGNLGGGGFMIVRMNDGRAAAIDFRETAPSRAHRRMYLDEDGTRIPNASTRGYLAAGVPGTVAGLALARERFGKLSWASVVIPSVELAMNGFTITESLARGLRGELLSSFAASRRVFQRDGEFYRAGETFRQPDLAATLRRIRDEGPRDFYEGETARLIAEDMGRGGGLITLEDLRSYRAVIRPPVTGRYRGHEIITMPPPSSGGIALVQMLNILERFDSRELTDDARRTHFMVESMRRAFADRAHYLGDPDFVTVPTGGLTSKSYARLLADSIDPARASRSADVRHGDPVAYESPQTTHYSVVDAEGNAVAVTYTLNSGFGNGVTVKGAGFLLNNEMDDFATRPGLPNQFGLIQGEANAVSPRKRPLSSMTPTIVLREGKLRLVLGSPGGPTIINTVLQVLTNVIDRNMELPEAVAAPRIHHQWLPDLISHERSLPASLRRALEKLGHRFKDRSDSLGDVQAILIRPDGTRIAVSDPRSPDGQALAQ